MNETQARNIIATLGNEFDSHEFIEEFIRMYEREYVELLSSHIDSRGGIFKNAHSQIGRYLSKNSTSLNIGKLDRIVGENIKRNENDNQNWRKL